MQCLVFGESKIKHQINAKLRDWKLGSSTVREVCEELGVLLHTNLKHNEAIKRAC